jgi:hypothetical protein
VKGGGGGDDARPEHVLTAATAALYADTEGAFTRDCNTGAFRVVKQKYSNSDSIDYSILNQQRKIMNQHTLYKYSPYLLTERLAT